MTFGFGFPFREPTEEEQAEMKAKLDRAELQMNEFRHSHQRLFEELNEDQLQALKNMLHYIVETNSPMLAATWEGSASAALKMRFNVCMTCNVNHDNEFPHPE